MSQVKIGNTIIGDGTVKICMPISALSKDAFEEELDHVAESPCDIVEIRYDYRSDRPFDLEYLQALVYEAKQKLSQKCLLFTYRTLAEGGLGSNGDDEYEAIYKKVIQSGHVDIVDIEFTKAPEFVEMLIEQAHKNNIKVIVSKHIFDQGLSKDEIIALLLKMQETSADIVKLAVFADDDASAQDVICAAKEMHEKHAKKPFVTIGMGEHGKITRYIEPFYGSSITYAKGMRATAPGQLDVSELFALR